MSAIKHLKRASNILYNHYMDEITEEGDWFYYLKNWTFNFVVDPDYEAVIAYKVKDGKTDWSDFIKLEERVKQWRELV